MTDFFQLNHLNHRIIEPLKMPDGGLSLFSSRQLGAIRVKAFNRRDR
jgi:hypothetical protein